MKYCHVNFDKTTGIHYSIEQVITYPRGVGVTHSMILIYMARFKCENFD